jgi:hypothetical protein
MKLTSIRRICMLTALSALALTGAVVSADPLPVPNVPKVVPVPAPLSPPNGVTANIYNTVFTWSHVGTPDKYILKLIILETGKVISVNVPLANCNEAGFCTMAASNVPALFDQVKDGDTIKWRAFAKFGVTKVKGTARTLIVDTVNAPTNLLPANGVALLPVHNLSWTNHNTNQSYVLMVKNAETGALISKQMLPHEACAATCSVSATSLGTLPTGSSLTWFVKAVGFNGDKAKSAKQTLFTLAAAN